MKDEIRFRVLLGEHRTQRGYRCVVQRNASFLAALRTETQMFLVPHMQNARAPVYIREFEEEDFLASQPRVHGDPYEFRPIIEVIRMSAAIFFGFRDQGFDLALSEIVRANGAVIAQQVHVSPG